VNYFTKSKTKKYLKENNKDFKIIVEARNIEEIKVAGGGTEFY
jgi:hypothetical protein